MSSSEQMRLSVNGQSQVPPGFRFHPTEEELLHYYLRKKVAYQKIDLDVIRDVDLNKLEPWDIQEKCNIGSGPQNDWYFFSHKDKKYPTGTRTNRATAAGFWKATGRDKVIHSNLRRIGMRKTLVFYRGRAPHGQKSDWIMHEYRLDDTAAHPTTGNNDSSLVSDSMSEEGWVVCRVFKKKNYGQKGGMDSSSPVIMETSTAAAAAFQMHNSSAIDDDHGVLDQILMYMGRSSMCKQEQLEAVANNSKYASPGCMHLPKLDNPTPSTQLDRRPPMEDDLYFQLVESEEVPDGYQGGKMNDWMAFDRLVASQLNGQVEATHGTQMSGGLSFCLSPVSDDAQHAQSTAEVVGFSVSRLSSDHTRAYDNSENDLWSFNRSSSSSSSDPLSHLSV